MSLIYFGDIQKQEVAIPIISDKILVDLVNSIQVNEDLISFQENQGFLGKIIDNITDADRNRQLAIDKNVNVGMQSMHDLVLNLATNLNVSNNAIVIVEEKLLEARQALRNHRQDIDLLKDITDRLQARVEKHEHRLNNLDVYKAIDRAFKAWESDRTYQGFYWAIQVAFITREIVDYTLTDYEQSTNNLECRQYLIDSLMAGSKDIPDNYFSLLKFLNLADNETLPENREIAAYLLEVESISPERLAKIPYLFTLGKTLELSQLPKIKNPAKTAFELCRSYPNVMIYPATSKREFVDRIVNETANDRLKSKISSRSGVNS